MLDRSCAYCRCPEVRLPRDCAPLQGDPRRQIIANNRPPNVDRSRGNGSGRYRLSANAGSPDAHIHVPAPQAVSLTTQMLARHLLVPTCSIWAEAHIHPQLQFVTGEQKMTTKPRIGVIIGSIRPNR